MTFDLEPATGEPISGYLDHGSTYKREIYHPRTLEQGSVPVIKISGAPAPGFRFWSGTDGGDTTSDQYINILAGDGYTVTRDTTEICEVTGHGFRVTVDGGGVKDPTVSDIYIQVYDS